MQSNTFLLSAVTAGLANMLSLSGHSTTEQEIVLGMEAPWLLRHEAGHYLAGAGLYRPKWLNMYAHAHGYHLTETILPSEGVAAFLRPLNTALLPIRIEKDQLRYMVFSGYNDGRYTFLNIKPEGSQEPDTFSYSAPMLKRRLGEQTGIYTLTRCQAEKVDFVPLLFESLDVLDEYQQDLLKLRQQSFTRAEFRLLHEPLFRALMLDELPMTALSGDYTLFEELRLLNHDYRHVFTRLSPASVRLGERLPYSSIRKCITWLKEDIVDRLYALGATDEMLESHQAKK